MRTSPTIDWLQTYYRIAVDVPQESGLCLLYLHLARGRHSWRPKVIVQLHPSTPFHPPIILRLLHPVPADYSRTFYSARRH
jgi:hypothetical protein